MQAGYPSAEHTSQRTFWIGGKTCHEFVTVRKARKFTLSCSVQIPAAVHFEFSGYGTTFTNAVRLPAGSFQARITYGGESLLDISAYTDAGFYESVFFGYGPVTKKLAAFTIDQDDDALFKFFVDVDDDMPWSFTVDPLFRSGTGNGS